MSILINSVYRLERTIEGLSIRLGAGKFKNTDAGLCRDCLLAGLPDNELCEGCRIHWLLHIHYSDKLQTYLSMIPAISGIVAGLCSFWLNHMRQWTDESPIMAEIAIFISSYIYLSLSPALQAAFETMLMAIWVFSTISVLITFGVSLLDPKWHPRCFWIPLLGYGIAIYLGISHNEFFWIILPQITGLASLSTIMQSKFRPPTPQETIEKNDKVPRGR